MIKLALALSLAVLVMVNSSLTGGAITAEAPTGPRLLAADSTGWVEGEGRWIALPWLATEGIQDLRVTASSVAPGVKIEYPQATVTYTAPQHGPDLGANELDVTMLYVSTTTATPEAWELALSASWEYRGRQHEGSATINVTTVSAVIDAPLHPLVGQATVTASGDGTGNWVDLAYLGLADLTSDVEISVDGELPVQYTGKLFSNLNHGDELVRGETDSARIWFDPNRLGTGQHQLTVTLQFRTGAGDLTQQASHPLVITVE